MTSPPLNTPIWLADQALPAGVPRRGVDCYHAVRLERIVDAQAEFCWQATGQRFSLPLAEVFRLWNNDLLRSDYSVAWMRRPSR